MAQTLTSRIAGLVRRARGPRHAAADAAKSWNIRDNSLGWRPLFGADWRSADYGSPTASACEAVYAAHPVVRACADRIGATIAEPRIEIGYESPDSGQWEPVKNHPLLDLLDAPHPQFSRAQFLAAIAIARVLTGAGYALKIRNRAGSMLTNLLPVPTSWITPVLNEGAGSLEYWSAFKLANARINVLPSEIVLTRDPQPGRPAENVGAVHSAWRAIQLDMEREDYQYEMVSNLKIPGVVIKTEFEMSPEAEASAARAFSEKFGKGRRGEPGFLSGQGAAIEVLNPLADMDWPGVTSLSETRICCAFGVSPLVIHTRAGLERSTYSNYEQAQSAFYLGRMAPLWESMADDLTTWLLVPEDGDSGLRFRFRYDELPAFQEDQNTEAQRVIGLYSSGLMSARSAREALELDADMEFANQQREAEAMPAPEASSGDADAQAAEAESAPAPEPEPAPAADDTGPTAASSSVVPSVDVDSVQGAALNGAQVTAMLDIIRAVADGLMPRESAAFAMRIAFPAVNPVLIEALLEPIMAHAKEPEPVAAAPFVPTNTGGGEGGE